MSDEMVGWSTKGDGGNVLDVEVRGGGNRTSGSRTLFKTRLSSSSCRS